MPPMHARLSNQREERNRMSGKTLVVVGVAAAVAIGLGIGLGGAYAS
jgi:hypothetical protein